MSPKPPSKVLPLGAEPVFWKSAEPPECDFLTRIAAAAFAVGYELISEKGFQHHLVIDEAAPDVADDDGADADPPARSVTWLWDGRRQVTFRPAFAEETIGIQEFRRRFEDLEWVRANPDHPISYMRAFLEQSRRTVAQVADIDPCVRIIRGDSTVVAPPGATAEEIEEQFALLDEMAG